MRKEALSQEKLLQGRKGEVRRKKGGHGHKLPRMKVLIIVIMTLYKTFNTVIIIESYVHARESGV